ncbi:MAG TPA: shikimate dehydrogenase [Methyloceanibacter sp.]
MRRACVIGWPIEHSRSPSIHGYWLKHYKIDGSYRAEAVRPEELSVFLKSLAATGYAGANVTLPHKEDALRLADSIDAAARTIGAANTLWLEAGKLHASNTDAYGFITNLQQQAPGWNDKKRSVIVLGAGGAARAVVFGLIGAGACKILLLNRSRDRADALAENFGRKVEVRDWSQRNESLAGGGLLVNATSLGMTGKPRLDLDLAGLPKEAVVADIVYNPLQTELLTAARARGNRIVDGLGMLLYQAVPGFEHWFGVRPEVTPELREQVATTLGRQ